MFIVKKIIFSNKILIIFKIKKYLKHLLKGSQIKSHNEHSIFYSIPLPN